MSASDGEAARDVADRDVANARSARALRAARTAALARRGGAARDAGPGRAYLVCACGPERFGLPLDGVARVLAMRPCTPVPGAASAILGLVALSGRIVSVVSLARALSRPGAGGAEGGHLVILSRAAFPVALAVDRVLGVARPAESEIEAHGFGSEAVSRYAPGDSGPEGLGDFVVIDLPRLLRRTLP